MRPHEIAEQNKQPRPLARVFYVYGCGILPIQHINRMTTKDMATKETTLQKINRVKAERKDWDTIADVLTPEGKKNIKKGDLMGFAQSDGTTHHYKFMRVNKSKDIFMVKRIKTYTPEEAEQHMEDEGIAPSI